MVVKGPGKEVRGTTKGTTQELKEEEMIANSHPDTQTEKEGVTGSEASSLVPEDSRAPPPLSSLRPEKSHQAPISTSCSFTQGYSCLLDPASEPFGPFNNPRLEPILVSHPDDLSRALWQ